MTLAVAADEWATTRRLPGVFAKHDDELVQRPAGSHGKTAFMRLRFEVVDGVTRMVESFGSGANVARRVLRMDTDLPDLAVVFVQSVGAGILQGDRFRTHIVVGEGARVLVTTQAATKLHEMDANYATQRIDIDVGPNAYAEVLMDPLIPCRGSRLYTELNFTVDPTASLIFQDLVTSGRVAHGESFEYDLLYTTMRTARPDGRLIVADTTVLEPKRVAPDRPGIMNSATDVGTVYLIAEGVEDKGALATALHERLQELLGISGSASVMPSNSGVYVRVLGAQTFLVEGALHSVWEMVRKEITGARVPKVYAAKHGFSPTIRKHAETDEVGAMT